MLSRLRTIPSTYPMAFGVVISTFKTSFSDLLVQKVVERKEEVDWRRNAAFATFGCFYLGGVQYAIYVPLFGRVLFPNAGQFARKSLREKVKDVRGMFNVVAQVFLDQCVHHPLLYFPVFYCTKELVINPTQPDFKDTLQKYRTNMKEDLLALWKIWVPSTLINFAFMPLWGRIPWVAGTSLIWTCILSAMRGGDVVHEEEMAGTAIGGITGVTMKFMTEGLQDVFVKSVDLDRSMSHICVSASGPDRVGWVSKVARMVADQGGNVTHSSMVRLGSDFIVLMHVAVKPEEKRGLISVLNEDEELRSFNVRTSALTRRQTGLYDKPVAGFRVHCVGEDRPGMLASISEKISNMNLSLENITTELRMGGPDGKRRDFVVDADCTACGNSDKLKERENIQALVDELSMLKQELDLDVLDIRVHMERP